MQTLTAHMTLPLGIDPAAASLAVMDAHQAIAKRLTQALGVQVEVGSGSTVVDKKGATQATLVLHVHEHGG